MRKISNTLFCLILFFSLFSCVSKDKSLNLDARNIENFNSQWKFFLGDDENAYLQKFDDSQWDILDLPHDWSISEPYDINNPGGFGTSFMIGGVGWYRKSFFIPEDNLSKRIEITFDGVYQNSTVWINGHKLGNRPFGYITFKYDLSPYIIPGGENIISVRVDNSDQPNSRWYSGSGIYRNVWLTISEQLYIDPWGVFVTTPNVNSEFADVSIESIVRNNSDYNGSYTLVSEVFSPSGVKVAEVTNIFDAEGKSEVGISQVLTIQKPMLWDVESPMLYTLRQTVFDGSNKIDDYITTFGIRYFEFSSTKGFVLNGNQVKIKGVCMHHDLGALGAAINVRAMERQLEILREMGVNGIRTAHNPPAPELLHLCDRMGFIVMNETFDMWKMPKVKYGYSLYWDEWHEQDLRDHLARDRNHPSVFIWSIGNEILEQWHPDGTDITIALANIVKELDPTRPITAGNNFPTPDNSLIKSGRLDLIGYNYKHETYEEFMQMFPGLSFIATETTSALATRGSYHMPSDSIRRWPYQWDIPFVDGPTDNSCSAYDNCSAPWGSTHEETWKVVKKHDFLTGMYIWTGFDYLGEPTPYEWPSRSSYFGVIDLAGFPKDAFYMYKSEWTNETVLHLFPHWNWNQGQEVDVWAYYNNADEVELFLNGQSLGVKSKQNDDVSVWWRVNYFAGELKAISRKNGAVVLEKVVNTALQPAKLRAIADRSLLNKGGIDLSFITIEVLDENDNIVPNADNLVQIKVVGNASVAGVDNGSQTGHFLFSGTQINAFNGKCLAIIRAGKNAGKVTIELTSDNLPMHVVELVIK
jgi:beta-galactosidase